MNWQGMQIIEDINICGHAIDWSDVRSPSRALRRRRMGHKQRVKVILVPKPDAFAFVLSGRIAMHPVRLANNMDTGNGLEQPSSLMSMARLEQGNE